MADGAGTEQTPRAPSRRRLITLLCVGFGVVFLVAAVIVSVVTGSVFQWAAVLFIGGIIGLLFGGYVWVRLSD